MVSLRSTVKSPCGLRGSRLCCRTARGRIRLSQDSFVTYNAQLQHSDPDGVSHLLGVSRCIFSDRWGQINVIEGYFHEMGILLINRWQSKAILVTPSAFPDTDTKNTPPSTTTPLTAQAENKSTLTKALPCSGSTGHDTNIIPPMPTTAPVAAITLKPLGARDEYSYHVNGTACSIKLNPTDTRSIRQRISDNYNNLGSNFSGRADEANRKMFEHNAKLDRWGNSMEFINGVSVYLLNRLSARAKLWA